VFLKNNSHGREAYLRFDRDPTAHLDQPTRMVQYGGGMFTIQQGIPCLTLTLCASRRSFGPRTGHWHVYAPRRVCGGRHTKGDHPHVVRLPSRRSRWRRRHDRSRRGGRILAAKRREQTVHRTAWAVRLARKHADRESHERGIKCVQPPLSCMFLLYD
jgi:hypothetical protein